MTPEDDEQTKPSRINLKYDVIRENETGLGSRRRIMESINPSVATKDKEFRAQFQMHGWLPALLIGVLSAFALLVPGLWIVTILLCVAFLPIRTHLPIHQLWRIKLDHVFLLCMSIEQADERLGDLDEKRERIIVRHGAGYARFWYWWTGLWIIVLALSRKLPGMRLLDAVISRIAKP